MKPRDLPLTPRASLRDLVTGKGRLVGSRTTIGRSMLGLPPGVISPYELSMAVGLRYGDPPIEEARYQNQRSAARDTALVARWVLQRGLARVRSRSQPPRSPADPPKRVRLDQVWLDAMDTDEAISQILQRVRQRQGGTVYFVNPHTVLQAGEIPALREQLAHGDLVLADGIGLQIAAHLLQESLPANVNGTDLIPELLLELAQRGLPLALIGGAPGVALEASRRWSRLAPVELRGVLDGFQSPANYEEFVRDLCARGPCVVLVGMGTPYQEDFVHHYLRGQPGVVGITVGGLFDFASGRVPRAPMAWRQLGLEWAWRFIKEPKRLGQRYLIGNPKFLYQITKQAWQQRRKPLTTTSVS